VLRDLSFGAGAGFVTINVGGGNDEVSAMALQPDGKIVLVGKCRNVATGRDNMCAARLDGTGALDQAFNGPGSTGNGKFLIAPGAGHNGATTVALQADGRIVMGGWCEDAAASFAPRFCVARLLAASGTLDTSFDGPGVGGVGFGSGNGQFLFANVGANDQINSLQVDTQGRLVLAGQCQIATRIEFCFARLVADGSFDTEFDGGGGGGNGRFSVAILGRLDFAYALTIQTDGKLVGVGACFNTTTSRYDFCAVRLHSVMGVVANPLLACGLDLDGNQMALAATDGVLAVRWLLGFRGSALTAGALGVGATRDAQAIHAHALAQLMRWDVDGDASVQGLTDGLMLLRALLGLRDAAMTAGALKTTGSRGSTAAVQGYLDAGCP
jgi:uncharacterized delta-60 repeat protein